MGMKESVQWWEERQLYVLVLGSLFLQYFLFIAAILRRYCKHPFFRFLTWLAYQGSDAVAMYALATLFNHQKKREWVSVRRGNAGLEALWAPVLLLHLGGQDGITAFSIEDNELWKRHVVTAASQITVAIYVFWKSLPVDIRLFQATILFFVPGILKCLEKPWALNRASIYNMADLLGSEESDKRPCYSPDSYVKEAVKYMKGEGENEESKHIIENPYKLFGDLSCPFWIRLENLKYMARQGGELLPRLYLHLFKAFDRFYTKSYVCESTRGYVVRTAAVVLTFLAIGLFHTSHQEDYSNTDIHVTYRNALPRSAHVLWPERCRVTAATTMRSSKTKHQCAFLLFLSRLK